MTGQRWVSINDPDTCRTLISLASFCVAGRFCGLRRLLLREFFDAVFTHEIS